MPIRMEHKGIDDDDVLVYYMYITKGDDLSIQLDFTDDGTAIDFTTCTALLTIIDRDDDTTVYQFTSSGGAPTIVLGSILGTMVISMADTTSSAIATGNYWYDLQVTDATGLKRTYIRGKCSVYREVTT